ncbi:MAG: hypothetical protein AB1346_04190 [Thermodesulfobacteriota bacterium]
MAGARLRKTSIAALLAAGLAAGADGGAIAGEADGRWLAGDFHMHTVMSDGRRTADEVASRAFANGLDWIAFSEHGGSLGEEPDGRRGADAQRLRGKYPEKRILCGMEWNVPGHEHASVIIATDDPAALDEFESACDASVKAASYALPKRNRTHEDAVACLGILARDGAAWFLPNHPSRRGKFTVADLREFNDAAPGVAFGFEGIPGHQKAPVRGGYPAYGGADLMAAKIGGAWDALLGEGRGFFLFANSDFHGPGTDFWPGEYAKSFTFVKGDGLKAVVEGMRSGNSFAVLGGLIDALSFHAAAGGGTATMGETLTTAEGDRLEVSIAFRAPRTGGGDASRVDHIDLIAGSVSAKALPGTEAYALGTNPTARIVARVTGREWKCSEGWCRAKIDLGPVRNAVYLRLRGTNLPPGTPGETDGEGNPLPDASACGGEEVPLRCNTPEKALADLWFYSNPIFIELLPPAVP